MRQNHGASVPDQALAVPVEPVARLDPTGFDPSRDGFDNARLLFVATRLARIALKRADELAYGAANALFCSADASREALKFFSHLSKEIDWFADQAAVALQASPAKGRKVR